MNLKLFRKAYISSGIFGFLQTFDGAQIAVTLEHAYPQSQPEDSSGAETYAPKVPNGTYHCTRRMSPHFGYEVFMLNDVPGCEFIEIHAGNTQGDSHGCILLGHSMGQGMILNSRLAFERFMELQKDCDSFELTVE